MVQPRAEVADLALPAREAGPFGGSGAWWIQATPVTRPVPSRPVPTHPVPSRPGPATWLCSGRTRRGRGQRSFGPPSRDRRSEPVLPASQWHSWEMERDTYYDILGVSPAATPEEIKVRYRNLLLRIHPDVDGSAALFRQVQQAYEALSDAGRRTAYDRLL